MEVEVSGTADSGIWADPAWQHPRAGKIRMVSPAVAYNGQKMGVHRAPPWLSEHTEEVLSELGYCAEERAELRSKGVV